MGLDVLPDGLDVQTATDDDLLAVVADRSRSSMAHITDVRVDVDERSLFGWVRDRLLPDGRWRVAPQPLVDQLADVASRVPMVLISGRQSRHINSQMMESESSGKGDPPDLFVHPSDATAHDIGDGELVRISSVSGSVVASARLDDRMVPGAVFLPHGFSAPNVGDLTSGTLGVDPLSGMVLQSGVAVSLIPSPRSVVVSAAHKSGG
jgi:anaerobic selenocysteine-containing dehydrogenase